LDVLVNIVSQEQTDYYLPLLVDPQSIRAFGILPADLQTKNVVMDRLRLDGCSTRVTSPGRKQKKTKVAKDF
jgi:hypothetical protein